VRKTFQNLPKVAKNVHKKSRAFQPYIRYLATEYGFICKTQNLTLLTPSSQVNTSFRDCRKSPNVVILENSPWLDAKDSVPFPYTA